jgi:hypothetical protein
MSDTVITSVAVVALSALAIGTLALLSARRRSVPAFLLSVGLLWGSVGVALGYYSSVSSLTPDRIPLWRHVASTFLGLAPLVLLPTALTIAPVAGRMGRRSIPLLAVVGVVVALPITFMTALASTCYIAFDCP